MWHVGRENQLFSKTSKCYTVLSRSPLHCLPWLRAPATHMRAALAPRTMTANVWSWLSPPSSMDTDLAVSLCRRGPAMCLEEPANSSPLLTFKIERLQWGTRNSVAQRKRVLVGVSFRASQFTDRPAQVQPNMSARIANSPKMWAFGKKPCNIGSPRQMYRNLKTQSYRPKYSSMAGQICFSGKSSIRNWNFGFARHMTCLIEPMTTYAIYINSRDFAEQKERHVEHN